MLNFKMTLKQTALIATIAVVLYTAVAAAMGRMGLSVIGPAQEFASQSDRITRLERSDSIQNANISSMQVSLRDLVYLQCREIRKNDPEDFPPVCSKYPQ